MTQPPEALSTAQLAAVGKAPAADRRCGTGGVGYRVSTRYGGRIARPAGTGPAAASTASGAAGTGATGTGWVARYRTGRYSRPVPGTGREAVPADHGTTRYPAGGRYRTNREQTRRAS